MTWIHGVAAIAVVALLSSCASPGPGDEGRGEPGRAAPESTSAAGRPPMKVTGSIDRPSASPATRPILRFRFRITERPVLAMSSLDDSAEMVFEATDGETGQVLRSDTRREGGRDRRYCEVETSTGRGWVPEDVLADVHWSGPAEREAGDVALGRDADGRSPASDEDPGDSSARAADEDVVTVDGAAPVPDIVTVRPAGSGEPFDAGALIVPGQYTIIDFYSDHCGPCRRLAPQLERVARSHARVVLRKVDVDRPGARGIDWGSPIVAQYGIRSLPHVEIYGPDGSLEGTDRVALSLIEQLGHQR